MQFKYEGFSIIYTADWNPDHFSVKRFTPPNVKAWDMTEREDREEINDTISGWSHRKWCNLLSEKQFQRFVDRCGLFADDIETMGSIGAPGFGFGWCPAIAFRDSDYGEYFLSAYVTPLIKLENGEEITEEMWKEIREDILGKYGI